MLLRLLLRREDIASGPLSHLQQWINPLSKLKSILQNKACSASRKNIKLQALSLWKPLFAGLGQLPLMISSAMAPNRETDELARNSKRPTYSPLRYVIDFLPVWIT